MPPVIIPPVHPAPDDESDHTVSDTETIRSESAELDDDDIANHPYYMEEMNPWLDPYWPADLDELAYVQSYGLDLFPYSRWENTRLGDFRDGKWWCCCDQPLEAAHRQTLKVNRNYGRLFFVCPKPFHPVSQQCGFFLWEDEQETRKAVVAARRAATSTPASTPAPAQAPPASAPPPPAPTPTATAPTPQATAPTPQATATATSTEPELAPATAAEHAATTESTPPAVSASEQAPAAAPSTSEQTPSATPATGPKSLSTPSSSNPLSGTPSSARKRPAGDDDDISMSSPSKAARTGNVRDDVADDYNDDQPSHTQASPCPRTPSKPRLAASVQTPFRTPRNSTLCADFMNLLRKNEVEVKSVVRTELVSFLQNHEVFDQGLLRSRDTCREAVKKRDAEIETLKNKIKDMDEETTNKIESLEQRIADLEKEKKGEE